MILVNLEYHLPIYVCQSVFKSFDPSLERLLCLATLIIFLYHETVCAWQYLHSSPRRLEHSVKGM